MVDRSARPARKERRLLEQEHAQSLKREWMDFLVRTLNGILWRVGVGDSFHQSILSGQVCVFGVAGCEGRSLK